MKRVAILLMLALLLRGTATAYTVNAGTKTVQTDGSEGDCTNGVNYAESQGQDGWTVVIGTAGASYVWNSPGTWVLISVTNTMTVEGASPVNRPLIYWNGTDYNVFVLACITNKCLTVKDLILNWTNNQPSGAMIGQYGEGCTFRLSNLQFNNAASSHWCINVGSTGSADPVQGPYGVIDHCQFNMPSPNNYDCVEVIGNGNLFHYGWFSPMSWGTTNCVVVEDCWFLQPNSAVNANACVESDGGARWCFRHNSSTNISISTHGIQSGANDSSLQAEVYGNIFTFNDSANQVTYTGCFRGGSSVVWSNTVNNLTSGTVTSFWQFWNECASTQEFSVEGCVTNWQYPVNYPSPQQIGQGACPSCANGNGTNVPCYMWANNTGGLGTFLGHDASDGQFIQSGRDVFPNTVMPGYTALVYPHPFVTAGGTPYNGPYTLPILRRGW